jgi:Flp pilus assembly protein TadD
MSLRVGWLGLLLCFRPPLCSAADIARASFVGSKTCGLCHQAIAATQGQTAMATTWQERGTKWLPTNFQAEIADDLAYQFKRTDSAFTYSIDFDGSKLTLPVDALMGGQRHGLGFLASLRELDGIPLARPTLVQARYEWSPERNQLLLAPGCAFAKPRTLDAALGIPLSQTFEAKCLSCHGQPNPTGGSKEAGVHCESCHGPGSAHLAVVNEGRPRQGIVNPKRLSPEESIEVCAHCHIGLTKFVDPSPDDLLIANQVRALRSSECFLQSGKAISCTTCHDPHKDAADNSRAVNACLSCHATSAKPHAARCPVNATSGCIGCHMPSVEMGPLHLVDHLIRVHPEKQPLKHLADDGRLSDLRTQIAPVSEFLRIITVDSRARAESALSRLRGGESFYTVARSVSIDSFAPIGGYLGRKEIGALDIALAREATRLNHGEVSGVVENGRQWVILQRLPRDFRWQAEEIERQAETLAAGNEPIAAITKAQEALTVYPHFLRALNFIGATFATNGNPKRAAEVLTTATRLYPEDTATEYALGSTLELLHDDAGAAKAYKRALALDEDFTAVYVNLGLLSYSAGAWADAATTFRRGLRINPLSAELYYDLGLALTRGGDSAGAHQSFALAHRLDPSLVEPALRKPDAPSPGDAVHLEKARPDNQ